MLFNLVGNHTCDKTNRGPAILFITCMITDSIRLQAFGVKEIYLTVPSCRQTVLRLLLLQLHLHCQGLHQFHLQMEEDLCQDWRSVHPSVEDCWAHQYCLKIPELENCMNYSQNQLPSEQMKI